MATLAFGALGAAIGSAVPGVGTLAGFQIGALFGGILFSPKPEVGKLQDLRVLGSQYGTIIPTVYGRCRLGGNLIWSTDLVPHKHPLKGDVVSGGARYTYSVSCAILICRGVIESIDKIYAEDVLIYDSTQPTNTKYNIHDPYLGTETQTADSLIVATEGDTTPAYRGLAYVVLENFDLSNWGNRIPSFSFVVNTGRKTVGDVLLDLATFNGVDPSYCNFDAGQQDYIDGFTIGDRADPTQTIAELLFAYNYDLVEANGTLLLIKRGNDTLVDIPYTDYGFQEYSSSPQPISRFNIKRVQDIDLPRTVDYTYFSTNREFQTTSQHAVRLIKKHTIDALTVSTSLSLSDDNARRVAEKRLYTLWNERVTANVSVSKKYIDLIPGSPIRLQALDGTYSRYRVMQVDLHPLATIDLTCVPDDYLDTNATTSVGGQIAITTQLPALSFRNDLITPTAFQAYSGIALRTTDGLKPGIYVTATGLDNWNGGTVYYSTDSGTTYTQAGIISNRCSAGFCNGALANGVTHDAIDSSNTVSVTLSPIGTLSSTSAADVMNGANACLIGEEVCAFETATLTGTNTYTLSNITRGKLASPMTGHVTSERFWLLVSDMLFFNVDSSFIGTTVKVKVVSSGQVLSEVTAVDVVLAANVSPFATPADLAAAMSGMGGTIVTNGDRGNPTVVFHEAVVVLSSG